MPRYFMHIEQAGILIEDPEGDDLPGPDDAYLEAVTIAREIMSGQVLHGQGPHSDKVVVVDARGRTVLTVLFKDAIS